MPLVEGSVEVDQLDDGDLGLLLVGQFAGVDHFWEEEVLDAESLLVVDVALLAEDAVVLHVLAI